MPMKTKKISSVNKTRSNARKTVLREVNAIDSQALSALTFFPDIRPDGDGEMPISAAVHWIASEGRKIDHDLSSVKGESHYCDSAKALFRKVVSGKVRVIGENDDGKNELISHIEFVALKPFFEFGADLFEAVVGNDKRLEINVSENRESRDIFRKPNYRGKWTNIYVFCEDIRREWPGESAVPSAVLPKTKLESETSGPFAPYPAGKLSVKPNIAREVMKKIWEDGVPDKSCQVLLAKVNLKYKKLGWNRIDGRGRTIETFTEEDIKRASGRRK